MKHVLIGWYGKHNIGDDVFAAIGRRTASVEDGRRPGISSLGRMPGRFATVPGFSRARRLASVARADLAILFGGSTLRSPQLAYRDLLHLRRLGRLRLAAFGVSIGPFASVADEQGVREMLRSFDHIYLRDQRSLEWAAATVPDVPAALSHDPAVLAPLVIGSHRRTHSRPSLGINVSASRSETDLTLDAPRLQELADQVSIAARSLGASVTLFEMNLEDRPVTRQMFSYLPASLPRRVVCYSSNLTTFADEVTNLDAMVASRLHGGLLAHLYGTPSLLLAYQQKHIDVARAVGMPDGSVVTTAGGIRRIAGWLEGVAETRTQPDSSLAGTCEGALRTLGLEVVENRG